MCQKGAYKPDLVGTEKECVHHGRGESCNVSNHVIKTTNLCVISHGIHTTEYTVKKPVHFMVNT